MGETLWLSETVVVQFERCKSIHFGRALQPVSRVVDHHAKAQVFLFDLSRCQTGEALEPSQHFPPSMRTECDKKERIVCKDASQPRWKLGIIGHAIWWRYSVCPIGAQ
jgi:hypothetical protein